MVSFDVLMFCQRVLIFIVCFLFNKYFTDSGRSISLDRLGVWVNVEHRLLSLTVGTKQCRVALGSCFVFCWFHYQWHFMTSLTGGETRDNCVDEFFYPRPYECGVLPHLAQPSFATPLLIYAATEASNFNLFTTFVRGVAYQNNFSGPKLAGSGLGSTPKIMGPPSYFCNDWSYNDFKFSIKLGVVEQCCQKQLLWPKLTGVWAREALQKFWDPLHISTTAEGSDFKFGIQLGLREYDIKTTFTTKDGVGVG